MISLFHDVYIPLDPADCMCSSVENVAADIQLRTSYNCSTTARCMQILCNVINTNSSLQSVDIVVNSCDNPPSLSLGVHTLDSSWTMHATDNTTMSLDGVGVVMLLKIWHYNYSMDVEVSSSCFLYAVEPLSNQNACYPLKTVHLCIQDTLFCWNGFWFEGVPRYGIYYVVLQCTYTCFNKRGYIHKKMWIWNPLPGSLLYMH